MVEDLRALETRLKSIQLACRDSIEDETGAVDANVVAAQAAAIKQWMVDFENAYIYESKHKPKSADEIRTAGRKLSEDTWLVYEALQNIEIDARGPPPTIVRWENLPSGVVFAEQKSDLLNKIAKVVREYHNFRRSVLLR
jgi:hypothetical protein